MILQIVAPSISLLLDRFVCSSYTVQQRWYIFVGQKIEMGSIVLNVFFEWLTQTQDISTPYSTI